MNKEQLTKVLQDVFRIEAAESSKDYIEYLAEDSINNAVSEEAKESVINIAEEIIDKYDMDEQHSAITSMIAETLLKNMTPADIEYVLKAYSSAEYEKFFTIVGEVLDIYSADITRMLDAGIGRKPEEVKILM